jgi:hypothetical protein
MPDAVTEPGWYRAGPKGLERVCGLDEELGDLPDDICDVPPLTELVRVVVRVPRPAGQGSLFDDMEAV